MKYAILLNPGHNRVYFEASKKLAASELFIVKNNLSVSCKNILLQEIEGVCYIVFETDEAVNSDDIKRLSRTSFIYALFEIKNENDNLLLRPIKKDEPKYFSSDINTILKYSGKTNELFTRLLLNAAVNSSDFYNQQINVLDPLAGKGTTLFEGLSAGYHAYGIEISPSAVSESVTFLKKYLITEKYKHRYHKSKMSGENKSFRADIHDFDIARDKEDLKLGDKLKFHFVCGDVCYVDKYFKKEFFHVIVGDLPYGVQHSNVSNQKQSSFTRNPNQLLYASIKQLMHVLKKGGTIALSWNKFVLSREAISEILSENGLHVFNEYPYDSFTHRVDQSINRDIIIAKK